MQPHFQPLGDASVHDLHDGHLFPRRELSVQPLKASTMRLRPRAPS
ncbi:MAG: hypothetical protein AAGA56_00580 [Myxococcota bacterium]